MESEWGYVTGRIFKTLKITKNTAARIMQIELEELP